MSKLPGADRWLLNSLLEGFRARAFSAAWWLSRRMASMEREAPCATDPAQHRLPSRSCSVPHRRLDQSQGPAQPLRVLSTPMTTVWRPWPNKHTKNTESMPIVARGHLTRVLLGEAERRLPLKADIGSFGTEAGIAAMVAGATVGRL